MLRVKKGLKIFIYNYLRVKKGYVGLKRCYLSFNKISSLSNQGYLRINKCTFEEIVCPVLSEERVRKVKDRLFWKAVLLRKEKEAFYK